MASAKIKLDPPPNQLQMDDPPLYHWLHNLYRMFNGDGGIDPVNLQTFKVKHEDLLELFNVTEPDPPTPEHLHLTALQYKAITDTLEEHDRLLTVTPIGVV